MNYFLGIDAGGTKTRAVIIDESSTLVALALGGPANYHNLGLVEAVTNVMGTIGQVLEKAGLSMEQITWCTIGIASCDTEKDYNRLFAAFSKQLSEFAHKITVVSDAKIGLYSGTLPPGIVVVGGTGANVYGINDHGESTHAGNWGHFLGDKGSGYQLGRRLFQTVIEVYDGILTEKSLLVERLERRLQIKSSADINDWYEEVRPSVHEISDFAVLVLQSAEEGDDLAKQLVDQTITELGRALMAVVKKLKMEDDALRIVVVGGMFESKYFRAVFEGHVTALLKRVRIIRPLVDAASGAALMGKHEWEKNRKTENG